MLQICIPDVHRLLQFSYLMAAIGRLITVRVCSPVSIQTQSLALRAFREFSRNKRKRQPIGMLGRSSGNHDLLLANASACVSCGFRLRNARNASDCV